MKLPRWLAAPHPRLIPLTVAVAVVSGGLAFRSELALWFAPAAQHAPAEAAPEASGAEHNEPPKARAHAAAGPAFDDQTLERVAAAFSSYEQIQALLASDSLVGLTPSATALKAALDAAAEGAPSLPEPVAQTLLQGAEAASQLGQSETIEQARLAFGELSRHMVTLAGHDARLSEGRHLFECPMTEGYAKWCQHDSDLHNPYMGQKMPSCGSASEWTAAPSAPAPTAMDAEHADHDHNKHGDGDAVAYFTCPMHPSVRAERPGKCPICGMTLTPVTEAEAESGTVVVDPVRRQRIGVRTDRVQTRAMTLKLRTVGSVRYDESRLHDVNLRMSGWVQGLRANKTGQRVSAGQTLFTLYSPELYAAQLEHLAGAARQQAGSGAMFSALAQASRQRLRLLNMSEEQIAALEKRGTALENVPVASPASGYVVEKNVVDGARVEAGMRVYRIADLSRVWVDAEIYESDLPRVSAGQAVTVEMPYAENARYPGKVDYVYPSLDSQTRTGRARVVLENPKLELKPDMYANVIIDVDLGARLAVPAPAIVFTGPRRLVFVDQGEGRLEPHVVTLGAHADGYYEVLSGLSEGDLVVTSGNFLIAAESRIRSATKYWSHDAPE